MSEVETQVANLGESGSNRRKNGVLVIGLQPQIKMHSAMERELPSGEFVGVGPKTPILDMSPVSLSSADLLAILMQENDAGRAVELVGHIVVRPTKLDERIDLTEEGHAAAAGAS